MFHNCHFYWYVMYFIFKFKTTSSRICQSNLSVVRPLFHCHLHIVTLWNSVFLNLTLHPHVLNNVFLFKFYIHEHCYFRLIDWLIGASHTTLYHLYRNVTNSRWTGRNFVFRCALRTMCRKGTCTVTLVEHWFLRCCSKGPVAFISKC